MIYSWGPERRVQGTPPVGEVNTRCDGCGKRFIAGQPYVTRMAGPFPLPIYAHPACVALAELRAAS